MSDRIAHTFETARAAGRKLLCPFFTAGFPSVEATPGLLLAAQAGGAGVIELGIPFSDPIADGPVIQASFYQALQKGCTVDRALATVAAARAGGLTLPVVAMVSFSIIFKRGSREFAKAAAANGFDGIILPDVPLEEAPAIVGAMQEAGLRTSLLVAPTTPAERREQIARLCDAFIYYLSVSGITGERKELPPDIAPNVAALRQLTKVPICVGFGISTAAHVQQVAKVADGAIVGSAIVRRMQQHENAPSQELAEVVRSFVTELASGLN